MKHATRRLVLMTAAAATLAATGFAQANSLFGAGNNGVYSEQQRFEKKDKPNGSNGNSDQRQPQNPGSSNKYPAVDQTNQVPEPGSLSLLALGLVAAWAVSRRRKD